MKCLAVRSRGKSFSLSLLLAVAFLVFAGGEARADSVCIIGGTELTGSAAPDLAANVLTITATTVGNNTTFTINANNLPSGAFVTSFLLNTTGAPSATGTFTTGNGGITGTSSNPAMSFDFGGLTVTAGNNNQVDSPFTGGDVLITLPSMQGSRLSSGESITFTVVGLNNVDLCLAGISLPGQPPGTFSIEAHIQGLGDNNQFSGRYTCTSCTNDPVPEPATMILLGTGLAGVGAAIRRRRRPSPDTQ